MKIKALALTISLAFALSASAQDVTAIPNLDLEEDTADVTTVSDIVKMQQKVLTNTNNNQHYTDVWRRRSYFNIAKINTSLKSDEVNQNFKNNWGFAMQSGTNYRLHKNPIQNMVSIALDYTWLDLNVNHFKAEENYTYDSSDKVGNLYKMPWGLEKYEASYGMNIGPSVTVAPFIPLENNILDHFKLQLYYHIGYNASFLYMWNNKKVDTNTTGNDYETMSNNLKLQWGHGMYSTFGINLIWKSVGVGFEHSSGSYDYKNINTDDFGKDKTKFKKGTSRLYITFRT